MADFGKGDRIVKMSGVAAGRYGTVNGVCDDGTLNVTFDGERLPRYCDPMRCGKVAANATFKKGDRVIWKGRFGTVRGVVERPTLAPGSYYIKLTDDVRITPTQRLVDHSAPASELTLANARAANREFAPGDKVCIGGRAGMERGEKVETIERVEGEGNDKFLFFKGSKWGMPARMYAYANSHAANAFADEATARRDIEQSLRKMADFAAGFTGAKASATPTHGDYHLAGYIDLKFPDGDKADAFNPYYLINELNGNKSVLPKWAWGVGGFSYERRGSAWRINVGRFSA